LYVYQRVSHGPMIFSIFILANWVEDEWTHRTS
jgi:hypothetical protein